MNNVNEHTVEEAKKSSILDYAEKIGISVFQTSNDEYRLKEHDSCVIKPSKNLFYWNSRQVGGGPIEFAKNFGIDSSLSEKVGLFHSQFFTSRTRKVKPGFGEPC